GLRHALMSLKDSLRVLQFERDRFRMRRLVAHVKESVRTAAEHDPSLQPLVAELFQEPEPYVQAIALNFTDAFGWLAGDGIKVVPSSAFTNEPQDISDSFSSAQG